METDIEINLQCETSTESIKFEWFCYPQKNRGESADLNVKKANVLSTLLVYLRVLFIDSSLIHKIIFSNLLWLSLVP